MNEFPKFNKQYSYTCPRSPNTGWSTNRINEYNKLPAIIFILFYGRLFITFIKIMRIEFILISVVVVSCTLCYLVYFIVTNSTTKIILTIPTINPVDNPFFEGDGPGDDG
jgi:hypothetical protein